MFDFDEVKIEARELVALVNQALAAEDKTAALLKEREESRARVERICPVCKVERADYEGPNGAWLPKCPNCGSERDPATWQERVEFLEEALEQALLLGRLRLGKDGSGKEWVRISGEGGWNPDRYPHLTVYLRERGREVQG